MSWWGLRLLHGLFFFLEPVAGQVVVGRHLPAGFVLGAKGALLAFHRGFLGLLGLALTLEYGGSAFSCHGSSPFGL
ncbi:MAG: hypothetical protein VX546_03405 [Myxococcota bacterium]|nr:hypothetical protein [Myxococcota bacterium]